jgi:hypothetical protein
MEEEIIQPDLTGLEETNIDCPRCAEIGQQNHLFVYPVGETPDDMTTGLICNVCFYFETE